MLKTTLMRILHVAVLSSMATFAFAEDAAPVYDADNYPPAFDGQPDVRPDIRPDIRPDVRSDMRPSAPVPEPAYVPDAPMSQSLSSEQRISRMEQQISNMQRTNSTSKVEALQSEIQALRGQVEQLTHQLQQVQNQQRTMYTDIDKRLSKQPAKIDDAAVNSSAEVATLRAQVEQLKAQKSPESAAKAKPTTPDMVKDDGLPAVAPGVAAKSDDKQLQPNVAEEQQIYQTAYDLIKSKKYNEAIAALQKMLQKYPTGQFAANAHYWLGELYGLLGKNDQSAKEFGIIVKNYPNSPKVSDAQLKLGMIYMAQSKWVDAKLALKKVINRFPGTASARLAAEQIKQIKEAGH